eukprot:scaffold16061_cov116-Isochrysis_galbana.AAC.3
MAPSPSALPDSCERRCGGPTLARSAVGLCRFGRSLCAQVAHPACRMPRRGADVRESAVRLRVACLRGDGWVADGTQTGSPRDFFYVRVL